MVSSDYYIADNSNMEEQKLEAARNQYAKGDYQAALKLYLSLVSTSISYKLYHRIGKCYYKINDFKNAEEFFLKSVGLQPNNNPSYYYLGYVNYRNENLKKAIYYWACAYAYKPEDVNIVLNLATSYFSCGMKFQSVFYYEKYLKYAQDKGKVYYEIKKSIDEYSTIGNDFLQKAKLAISRKNYTAAIEFLTFAYKNLPTNYEINYLLGTSYLKENDNMHAMIHLQNAYCINNTSVEVLHTLTSVMINLGYYTTAFCMLKRILPFTINNQQEYLETLKVIKDLKNSFNAQSYVGHKEWGDNYWRENNFHFALFEYENAIFLNENLQQELSERIRQLHSFINPEPSIIKNCIEEGEKAYKQGDFQTSNKFFSKVVLLSSPDSPEYKLAKSRV